MIKYIAFDLVGVLVREKDIELTKEEALLERMFGPNLNDADYISEGRKIVSNDASLIATTLKLISKLYYVVNRDLFKEIKQLYPSIKIIIATNHISFVRDYIGENIGIDYLDDLIISAEVHHIKPNADFYNYILSHEHINNDELLFVDDNIENVDGANKLGIKTIHATKDSNLIEEIKKVLGEN